jgi:phosphatidylinositol alpha-1,6-mannosyltransferase
LMQNNGRVVICALETYSKIGGLQNFNRRVFQNLARRAVEQVERAPLVVLRGDQNALRPTKDGFEIAAPKCRICFYLRAVWSGVANADVFIIGHINLLPLAAVVRVFRPKLPILLFVHGDEVWNIQRQKRFYETWFVRALTQIASVSQFTAGVMAREFNIPLTKFVLLPNAVDRLTAAPEAPRRQTQTILTVTRLGEDDRAKNVDKMVRAVAALRQRLPGVKYDIIGDGALAPELKRLVKDLGADDIIRFHGQVGDAELHAAYARASVFAMPSNKEGFGIVYLEAWQRGLPVICSSFGASSEIVADGLDGFVVDPDDLEALVERLYLLLSQHEIANDMGERGRQKVEQKYLNSNFRANLDQILAELLVGSSRSEIAPIGLPQLKR